MVKALLQESWCHVQPEVMIKLSPGRASKKGGSAVNRRKKNTDAIEACQRAKSPPPPPPPTPPPTERIIIHHAVEQEITNQNYVQSWYRVRLAHRTKCTMPSPPCPACSGPLNRTVPASPCKCHAARAGRCSFIALVFFSRPIRCGASSGAHPPWPGSRRA